MESNIPKFFVRVHVDWTDYDVFEVDAKDENTAIEVAKQVMLNRIEKEHPSLSNFEITSELDADTAWALRFYDGNLGEEDDE